jgi:ABC-2 type transport system permease protein
VSSLSTMYGIIARDLTRTTRQKGRLLGGIVRPFMWLLLVGTGFNAIARVEGGVSYQAFVYPGIVVLALAPLFVPVSPRNLAAAVSALALGSVVSSGLGLLVAARLRSVENFAGVINVVLFPLLFVSGALYPTDGMPSVLRLLARINPVTYQVDLMRHAFGQPTEFSVRADILVLTGSTLLLLSLAGLLFDPEQRFVGRRGSSASGPELR